MPCRHTGGMQLRAPFILNLGTRWSRKPHTPAARLPLSIEQVAAWGPEPVIARIQNPDQRVVVTGHYTDCTVPAQCTHLA